MGVSVRQGEKEQEVENGETALYRQGEQTVNVSTSSATSHVLAGLPSPKQTATSRF